MDYFSCLALDVSEESQTFKCTIYQPDWEGRGEEGISDGYPRFGEKEKEVFGTFIDARSSMRLDFIRLNMELGAATLLVGCTATLALLY